MDRLGAIDDRLRLSTDGEERPSMSGPAKATVWRIAAIITLSAGVFIADLALPLGVVAWALYVVLLLLCLWVRQRQMPLWLAAGYTILLMFGFLYAPRGLIRRSRSPTGCSAGR